MNIIVPKERGNQEHNCPLFEFSSVSQFGRYLRYLDDNKIRCQGNSSGASRDKSWDLGLGLPEAIERTEQGGYWEEGAKALSCVNIPESYLMAELGRPSIESSIVGCVPCVPNLLAGNPDSMLSIQDSPQKRRVLRVAVEVAYPASTPADSILNFGRGVLSVIDELETAGISIELWAVTHNMAPSGKWRLEILVKDAGAFWSADTVAFVICHPGFYRRSGFRFQEAHPETSKECSGGYGNARGAKYPDFDVSFGYEIPDKCRTPEGGIEYAVQTFCTALKKLDEL